MSNVIESQMPWLTPQYLLQLLRGVDGAGSGLDADTLDGLSSALFSLRKNVDTGDAADLSSASWGNTTRYCSLCVNGFGYSTALLVNAYKVADTRHLYDVSAPSDLQTKYFGANYLGVQRPIMLHFDPNAGQIKTYVGTAGLNSGDLINSWTNTFTVTSAGLVLAPSVGANGAAPATSGAAGTKGEMRSDASYLYVCTAANTWKRIALVSF